MVTYDGTPEFVMIELKPNIPEIMFSPQLSPFLSAIDRILKTDSTTLSATDLWRIYALLTSRGALAAGAPALRVGTSFIDFPRNTIHHRIYE